jgi:uncharacterized protein (TIGR02118 family)
MIFRSGIFSKRAGLTDEAFTEHWINGHGPLASVLPGLHSYIQNHIDERIYERTPFPSHAVAGISQLWFDDIEAMERAETSPEYAACKLDIPKFQGEITILVLEAQNISSERASLPTETRPDIPGDVKLLWYATSRRQLDQRALKTQLQQNGWPITAAKIPGACHAVVNVVVDSAHPVSAGVPQGKMPADVLAEIWFDSIDDLTHWVSSLGGAHAMFDNPDLEALAIYRVHEIRIV